jgi:hypothetical protein
VRVVACVAVLCLSLVFAGTVAASAKWELLKELQVKMTWANIRGQYGFVWPLLNPQYQRVTTRAFWEACQRKRARQTAGVKWISVKATDAYPGRITLPLLGSIPVVAISVEAKFKYLGSTRTVRDTFYWTDTKLDGYGMYTSLWDPATYRAYKAHRCPTHSSPTVLP